MEPPAMQPDRVLRDGARIPPVGIGTYVGNEKGHSSPEDCARLVAAALANGYRHFDSALMYMNERELGVALRQGKEAVPPELYVTTKVAHPNDPGRGHVACAYMEDDSDACEGVLRNVRESAERLGLGRPVDLVLLHWPGAFESSDGAFNERKRWEMWQGLERAQEEGLCRSIGLSNFTEVHLDQLWARGPRVLPAVNQVECHVLHGRPVLRRKCADLGMLVVAWSPLGLGADLEHETVQALAARHNVTPAAVCLRWLAQRGVVPVPRSVDPARQRANFAAVMHAGFVLSDEDLAALDALDQGRSALPPRVSPSSIA